MRCRYCFYADVSSRRAIQNFGLMQAKTTEAVLHNIIASLSTGDTVTLAFQGGEPTLAGLAYFEHFVETAAKTAQTQEKNIHIDYALQTNGLVLDDAWCSFLARHHFLVGLSLDGNAAMHDANRVDAAEKGTHRRILNTKELLEQHHVEYNVLWVLTNYCARFPQKVWQYLRAQNIRYVQFIPCLDELDGAPSQHALQPERFASFYIELYKLWEALFLQGDYFSVKLFDDVCNLLGSGNVTACGLTGRCNIQYVVEADGSVYPCDFYVLDEWHMGSLCEQTADALEQASAAQAFLKRPHQENPLCGTCEFAPICGGGCVRMHRAVFVNQTGDFCGYRAFLQQCGARLQQIGRRHAHR